MVSSTRVPEHPSTRVTPTATATATTSQQLSQPGRSQGVSRTGTKYPVRGIPHSDSVSTKPRIPAFWTPSRPYSICLTNTILDLFSHVIYIKCQSEGFPERDILSLCVIPPWDLSGWESCWDVAAVAAAVAAAVILEFRSRFRPGNYIWSFSYGSGVVL